MLMAFLCAGWLKETPLIHRVDEALVSARFGLSPQAEDFESAVIAIDTGSLQANRAWPWPRTVYAEVVRRLDAAGAAAIAFDIDFSSPGIGDEAFAGALREAQAPVFLAGFRQPLPTAPEVMAEITPNPTLLPHAELASTVFPIGKDGTVRYMPSGEVFSTGVVPSLAYALADRPPDLSQLTRLDAAQRLELMPIIPISDLLGGVDLDEYIRGKTVFVGATAVELGDEFVVPMHGLIDGVIINALAFETARRNGGLHDAPAWLFILFVGIGMGAALMPIDRIGAQSYTLTNTIVGAGLFFGSLFLQSTANIVVPTATAHLFQIAGIVLTTIIVADSYGEQLFRSHMSLRKNASVLKAMMNSNLDGLLTVNRDGLIETLNHRAATMLGIPHDEAVGQPMAQFAPAIAALPTEGMRHEFTLPSTEPTHVSAFFTKVVLPVSQSRYEKRRKPRELKLFILNDITAQKIAEAREREAKEAHARASTAKSELIGMMSHELRTPLNSVIGFADLIRQEAFGAHTAPEYTEFADLIAQGGRNLLQIVNDMLLAGQLQSGGLTPSSRPIDAAEALDAALARAAEMADWTDAPVEREGDTARLMADPDLLTTALSHLIHNAAKFGGPDTSIALEIEAAPEAVILRVIDHGPGPTGDDLERLTGLFVQGDSARSRQHEGCGMGLFLASRIATLLGGRLDLHAPAEGGMIAALSLPRAKALEAAA